ncbi:MAG: (Fe-S)-binding protein [Caldilineaceae bacterium]
MQKKQFETPPHRVALFVTCMVDMMYPEVGLATVELLERHGVEVVFPEEQTCFGQPAFNAGFRAEASQLARRFIDVFWPLVYSGHVQAIVAPSGSCTTMTRHFYATLLESVGAREAYRRAEELAGITFELTEFLVDVLGVTDVGARFAGKLTYHACCHLLRELRVDQQPRALLDNIANAELTELEGAEECCGFGGLFAIKNAGISTAMGQRKTQNLAISGADVVALCDVSCMTHINGLLSRQGQRCRAVHIAQVLNSQVDVDDEERANDGQATADAPPPKPDTRQESDRVLPFEEEPTQRSKNVRLKSKPAEVSKPRRWQDL